MNNLWIVPAAGPDATAHVHLSLSKSISEPVLRKHRIEERHAWGCKTTRQTAFNQMMPGDLCLFYTSDQPGENRYNWAAHIIRKQQAVSIGQDIWNDPEYECVFFLDAPVLISLTTTQLGAAFSKYRANYFYSHPMGLTRIQDEVTEGILKDYQSLDTWLSLAAGATSILPAQNFWIFQGNPDQFDVDTYVHSKKSICWSVRQHRDRILKDDRVLIWRSGANGGVIAECVVVAPPSIEISEDAPELWKELPENQPGETRCRLRVVTSFVETPIPRDAIRTAFPELSIVRAPQGTNFEITMTDYERIMKLREPSIREPFDAKSVDAFEHGLRDAGVVVSRTLVIRMLSSLASKNLVLLTGLAGSGKTKLAQALARWLRLSSNCFRVVAVGADWTGNENVLGYPNGLEKASYISKPSLDVILHAKANQAIPHFLILDEMNLSHVERYFADILSAIESDEKIHLHQDSERKANGTTIPAEVELPKNLFIIGTVNVDETTYMFSPKVLDRANVIEFRMHAEELAGFLGNPAKPDLSKLDGKGAAFGKAFVDAAKNAVAVPADVKAAYDAEMLLLFKTLQGHGAEFGYRTAYETARFIHFYKLLGNHPDGDTTWFPGAFDCVVFQKLLPKLHGSRAKLGPVLKKLWFLCVNDAAGRGADALKAAEEAARSTDKKAEPSVVVPAGSPYPLSAEKIGRMWRLLIENGFASFAEA